MFVLTSVAAALAQVEPYSANWVMPGCRATVSEQWTVEQYRQGVCAGEVLAVWHIAATAGWVCVPPGVSNGQAVRVVARYIGERTARLDEPFARLAMEALRAAWPCGRGT